MRRLAALLLRGVCFCTSLSAGATSPAAQPRPQQHEYVLHNFRTESGTILPEARLIYGTMGTLNADRSNAVLLPSHYMADMNGYDFLVMSPSYPKGALDPSKFFLITTELFGNGRSSSPSNTPPPFDGPRFSVMTIRDNVEAVHKMLTEELHIRHLRAVVGFSMGAQQAFQWTVSYPTFMDRAVATSGTAKTYGHGVVRLEGQIAALTADQAFMGGNYKTEPTKGLEAFGMVWAGWLYSQEWWRKELWRTISPPGTTFEEYMFSFRKDFSADANNYILQARTWESNDVGKTMFVNGQPSAFQGDVEKALRSIEVPVLYMPSATDLYFPLEDAQYEAAFIPHCKLLPIPSLWGHPAGAGASPADKLFLNQQIATFLSQ